VRVGIDRDLPIVQSERDHDFSSPLALPFTRIVAWQRPIGRGERSIEG
jgi:hypothetical protein